MAPSLTRLTITIDMPKLAAMITNIVKPTPNMLIFEDLMDPKKIFIFMVYRSRN